MLRYLLVHLLASEHAVLPLLCAAALLGCIFTLNAHLFLHFFAPRCMRRFSAGLWLQPPRRPRPPKACSHSVGDTLFARASQLIKRAGLFLPLSKRRANRQIMTHPHVIMSDYCHITVIAFDCQPPRYHM